MKKFLILFALIVTGCGTAKDVYYDKKLEVCEQKCALKYGKYESTKRSQCLSECRKNLVN